MRWGLTPFLSLRSTIPTVTDSRSPMNTSAVFPVTHPFPSAAHCRSHRNPLALLCAGRRTRKLCKQSLRRCREYLLWWMENRVVYVHMPAQIKTDEDIFVKKFIAIEACWNDNLSEFCRFRQQRIDTNRLSMILCIIWNHCVRTSVR